MNCPVCDGVRMREVEKEGVMVDICPSCKGVWLDRGELEKLMEGERELRRQYPEYGDSYNHGKPYDDDYGRYEHNDDKYPRHKKKRRVFDIFEDLFD